MGMRAGNSDSDVLRNESGKFVGIVFGADYCAEHEWGIGRIHNRLGIKDDESVFGIERRRVTVSQDIMHFHSDKYNMLAMFDDFTAQRHQKDIREKGLPNLVIRGSYPFNYLTIRKIYKDPETGKRIKMRNDPDWEFSSAWCDGEFAILASTEKLGEEIHDLYKQLGEGNVACWLGGAGENPFARNSLCLGIIDRVDQANLDMMKSYDEEHYRLKQEDKKTGLRDKIKAQGEPYEKSLSFDANPKGSTGLQAKWAKDIHRDGYPLSEASTYKVVYCIHPVAKDGSEGGWYTVEEIEHWLDSDGPLTQPKAAAT